MIIRLYKNTDDRNVVNKHLTTLIELTGDLREETNFLDPVFLIENPSGILTGGQFNYIYCPDLRRYYFVNDIKFVSNTLFAVYCHVDVLMTYKAQILENSALVRRQEFNYNTMLSDPKLKTQANPLVQTLKFPNAFNEQYSFVLNVLGNS